MNEATRTFMYGKIHRIRVTEADLNYVGSITIDPLLLVEAGLLPYTQVDVVNITSGGRLQTYIIEGRPGSGDCCLNGAAAHLFNPGDLAIIMAYEQVPLSQLAGRESRAVMVDPDNNNKLARTITYKTPTLEDVGNHCRHGEKFSNLLSDVSHPQT